MAKKGEIMPKDDKNICPGITEPIQVDQLNKLIHTKDEERIITVDYLGEDLDIDCEKSILEGYKENLEETDIFVEIVFDYKSQKAISIYSGFYKEYKVHKEFIFDFPMKNKILYRINLNRVELEKNLELFEDYSIYTKNFQTILDKSVIENILSVATDESIKIAINDKYLVVYDSKKSKWLNFFEIG